MTEVIAVDMPLVLYTKYKKLLSWENLKKKHIKTESRVN